jgi:putative hemolysin
MDWMLIIVAVSLAASFVLSASETALTSLGKLEAQTLLARGDAGGRLIHAWVRDPHRILITVLVGNNIANTAASSLIAIWIKPFTSVQITVGMAIFAFVLIVGCEIVPKLLARSYATQLAVPAIRLLLFVNFLLKPIIWVTQRITDAIVRLTGKNPRETRILISEEELTHTIEIATKEGGIDRETGEVLSNLIGFPDRLARDIMTPRSKAQAVSVSWSQNEVMRYIAVDGHSRYPVIRNSFDEVIGVLLVKDLLAHIQKGSPGLWTRTIRRPYFVSELGPLGRILRDMKRWGTHMALVRNEAGLVTGLVTLEDLIEEIVGEIRDEHDDPGEAGSDRAMGGPLLVSGDMPIIDFNEKYNAGIPLEMGFSTLNGYLLSKAGGETPPIGTLVIADDITFRIHSISDTGIVTVQIMSQSVPGAQ